MKDQFLWHMLVVVAQKVVPPLVVAVLAALADVGLLDGLVYDQIAKLLGS